MRVRDRWINNMFFVEMILKNWFSSIWVTDRSLLQILANGKIFLPCIVACLIGATGSCRDYVGAFQQETFIRIRIPWCCQIPILSIPQGAVSTLRPVLLALAMGTVPRRETTIDRITRQSCFPFTELFTDNKMQEFHQVVVPNFSPHGFSLSKCPDFPIWS